MDLTDYPKLGECWACAEYHDDYSVKTVVAYCMAGDMCEEHKDDDGIEQITNPSVIEAVDILVNPNQNRMN